MFVAAAVKELRQHVLPTMVSVVRHCTMISIAQTTGMAKFFIPLGKTVRLTSMKYAFLENLSPHLFVLSLIYEILQIFCAVQKFFFCRRL